MTPNSLASDRNPSGFTVRKTRGPSEFVYDPDHRGWRTEVHSPNGTRQLIDHDDSGRVTSVELRGPAPANTLLQSYDYTFDNPTGTDRAVRRTEATLHGSTTYAYDAANRLTGADYTDNPGGLAAVADLTFTYDGNHNRRTSTRNGVTTTYTYNNADQLTSGGATYDANGNMTASSSYGLAAAGYNASDHTTSLTPAGASAIAQSYAGATQSQWRTSGSDSFVTAASLGITAIDRTSDDITFVRDPNGTLVSMRRGGNTYHYAHDGRGSVSGLTNNAGALANSYVYEPYGRRHAATEAVGNPFQYNAGYTLGPAGTLYKYGARYYDTNNANWTQHDPMPDQPRYAYVAGDPINQADPTGYGVWDGITDTVSDALGTGGCMVNQVFGWPPTEAGASAEAGATLGGAGLGSYMTFGAGATQYAPVAAATGVGVGAMVVGAGFIAYGVYEAYTACT